MNIPQNSKTVNPAIGDMARSEQRTAWGLSATYYLYTGVWESFATPESRERRRKELGR